MPEGASATPATGSAPVPLASALAGGPTAFVRADVALDGEPVIGSFTVDGMTFAVVDGGSVELVGIAPGSQPGDPSEALAVPEPVAFEGIDYVVSSIGAYAFYLSGVVSVSLPASVGNVDERAFRSSDVASIEADPANPSFASFDGALYSADLTRLLLIPGGRQGAVRIPSQALDAPASAFSHCALVTAIDADAGGAAYSSWEGLLYDAAGTTLLRVPAGATDITIRGGCTTIAAGALEGCASLATITAPASVTSVSPYLFERQPETIMAPVAVTAIEDETGPANEGEPADAAPQITALVALSSTADDLPEVDPAAITVQLPEGANRIVWDARGFIMAIAIDGSAAPTLGSSATYAALSGVVTFHVPVGYRIAGTFHTASGGGYSTVSTGSGGSVTAYYRAAVAAEWVVDLNKAASWANVGTYYSGNGAWKGGDVLSVETGAVCDEGVWCVDTAGRTLASAGYHGTEAVPAHLYWFPARATLSYDPQGGMFPDGTTAPKSALGAGMQLSDVLYPSNPARTGYTFAGWWTGISDGSQVIASAALPATDTTYYARWEPTISADVPIEVTARVDVLGIEEQEEAQGYIESRCGEPLTVADVAFEPLAGATELFGAASVADVALEVLAASSNSPDARFALDASASQAPASTTAFRMASYGTRVPISYRFAIPDELLPSLVEATKPVCSVAYTVALA